MPVTISKTSHAEIAHYLEDHPFEKNRRIHGHSLKVVVTAGGQMRNGMVLDFSMFGDQVDDVVGLLDHTYLNDHHPDIDPPTLENIALWIGTKLVAGGGSPDRLRQGRAGVVRRSGGVDAVTVHYHGTPITPHEVLFSLAGRSFCVSHARPDQVEIVHRLGQSVMLDNGAFSAWKRGHEPDWSSFYDWCDRWLDYPTTWAVIPDVVDGGSQLQDALLREWPHGQRGAPVWHMDEPLDRLLRLVDEWPRVCIGSTAEFAVVMSEAWHQRMTECWNEVAKRRTRTPAIHMLRGMQCGGSIYPFASVDSTDIAQNHNRPQNVARDMADRWDALQCPGRWVKRRQVEQLTMRVAS